MRLGIDGRGSEEVELTIIDSGAEDYEKTNDGYLVYTQPKQVKQISDKLSGQGFKVWGLNWLWSQKKRLNYLNKRLKKLSNYLKLLIIWMTLLR